ncbi:hypothetical protein NP493_675g03096 [Ridgeia piscesae]|uniref:Platelet-derived growth factor (PDGF) family profile domain-containing protein n=1 Tax=Ridgeia piscesae TaxID=27915 RepID=A0AAD9NQY7_RIDPI|nr:hypothetical protein NP493_675g03096 [Ridgeia piscesae]
MTCRCKCKCVVSVQEVPMEAVPVQMVAQRIQEADTYHDVLSLFYGDRLPNEIIDTILATQWHGHTPSKTRPRPRIGGLSDTMSFSPHETTFQGSRPHLNSSHVCVGCSATGLSFVPRRIAGRTRVTARTARRRVRRHKKRRGRRKGRGRKRNRKGKKRARKRKRNKKRKGPKRKRKRKGRRRPEKALSKAFNHAKEMEAEAQCSVPKPRLVCMRDVSSAANKDYFPRCTVVHQCSPSVGCCNASSECSPVNTTIITRHFLVVVYTTPGLYDVKMDQTETFTFVNHTACGCLLVNQPPKCKKCPFPFEIRHNEKAECRCECFSDDINCLRIKKGQKPLSESELACLKANMCERPKCSHGEFDETSIKTGYCPSASTRSAWSSGRRGHSRYRVSTHSRISLRRRRAWVGARRRDGQTAADDISR